jgi:hypothetical protein
MVILWSSKNIKNIQWLQSILQTTKKKVKSPTVGDLKRSPTVAFAEVLCFEFVETEGSFMLETEGTRCQLSHKN